MVSTTEITGNGSVRCSAKPVRKSTDSFTNVEFAAFTAGNAVNDVRGGGASEVLSSYEIRFRSGSMSGGIKESVRVATRTTKGLRSKRQFFAYTFLAVHNPFAVSI